MQAEPEQIIRMGHTTPYEWQELAQRSKETGIKIDLQCPECHAEIYPTDTTPLRCLSCHAPVEVYQHREITETADTRIIYAEVSNAPFFAPQGAVPRHSAPRRTILTLDLQCLSCERTLQADETCTNTCRIQTYLTLEHQDGELYIKRAANLPHVPRETHPPEIESRNLPPNAIATGRNDTPHNENRPLNPPPNQPLNPPQAMSDGIGHNPCGDPVRDSQSPEHHNAHIDVKGQVEAYLTEHHIATTPKLRDVCNCSREALNQALHKLINTKQIRRVKRGVYQLINHT